jgi:hypothetical protein
MVAVFEVNRMAAGLSPRLLFVAELFLMGWGTGSWRVILGMLVARVTTR